jgi:transcriptional regulator with XRE-family HTH domain
METEDSRSDNLRNPAVKRERARWERIAATVLTATRKNMDISQQELAARTGWTRNMIANLESGRRSLRLSDFIVICQALGEDPDVVWLRILRWGGQVGRSPA